MTSTLGHQRQGTECQFNSGRVNAQPGPIYDTADVATTKPWRMATRHQSGAAVGEDRNSPTRRIRAWLERFAEMRTAVETISTSRWIWVDQPHDGERLIGPWSPTSHVHRGLVQTYTSILADVSADLLPVALASGHTKWTTVKCPLSRQHSQSDPSHAGGITEGSRRPAETYYASLRRIAHSGRSPYSLHPACRLIPNSS
jgi:hypothetical protein